jgi:hypothetical protein
LAAEVATAGSDPEPPSIVRRNVRGNDLATVRTKGETFQIAAVLVIGILQEPSMLSVPQNVCLSVFKIDERMA